MSAPTPINRIPATITPRKLVNLDVDIDGVIPPQAMQRLGQAVEAVLQATEVWLHFGGVKGPDKVVTGKAITQVSLRCERCLQNYAAPLQADISVGVVWSEEEAAQLPSHLDPWLVPEEDADLVALVEDELLLALPIVALHQVEEDCPAPAMSYGPGQEEGVPSPVEEEARENPFKILEQLKNRSEKE